MIRLSARADTDTAPGRLPVWAQACDGIKAFRLPRPLMPILVSVLSWLLIADLLVATGALHHLVSLKPSPLRVHSLEQQLFALDQTDFRSVIVGDPLFIEKARANLSERADKTLFLTIPGFHLRDALAEEPVRFFEDLLVNYRPVADVIAADAVVVNDVLAQHYGIPGVTGPEWRRVENVSAYSRGGLLGFGAVLA